VRDALLSEVALILGPPGTGDILQEEFQGSVDLSVLNLFFQPADIFPLLLCIIFSRQENPGRISLKGRK